MSDIRKWFMKQHDKGNGNAGKPAPAKPAENEKPSPADVSEKPVQKAQANPGRRKTSKYFATTDAADADASSKQATKDRTNNAPAKRKSQMNDEEVHKKEIKPSPRKKLHQDDDDDDDFAPPNEMKKSAETKPLKKLKSSAGVAIAKKSVDVEEDEEDEPADKDVKPPVKAVGRGRGGRGSGGAVGGRGRPGGNVEEDEEDEPAEKDVKSPAKAVGRGRGGRGSGGAVGGRGRGGGRGGYMNFGERKDPPHKGEKEVPVGAPDCLAGLTFVISGTLDSLEREEAEDLIKRHGGRVTGSVSKRTSFLLVDEDIGGNKSSKAKELGTAFLTEDGLFDMIRKSKPAKARVEEDSKKKTLGKAENLRTKSSPIKAEIKYNEDSSPSGKGTAKSVLSSTLSRHKGKTGEGASSTWSEKYRPKVPDEIIGNQSLVKQLHDWLQHWNEIFLHAGQKGKGKKQNDGGLKKAVLLSGSPGIGKTTSAKLISQMLGFQAIEVNASDSRGKADSKINKGIGGSMANSIKELVSNEALSYRNDRTKRPKSVLIMDEVDGMSAGDRGGVADLIASIKISKIPIICICNDRYSQKLKSLVNYCMQLNFRKPTKQQVAKRLMKITAAEGLQVNEIALEELADRVNGDMRMALNQLQYMSLSQSVIKYDDIRERLLSSAKDEDISPFTAVDKLFGFNGGKLRMDERMDLSMSDPDLVPLIIQENYINYRPTAAGNDNGIKRMKLIARAAESIADGDIVNVQIRRYRQWQLSQAGSFASSIIPAALMHGSRENFEGERNFNRFGGWLGKNSTMGKNLRLLQDAHNHILASQESNLDRETLRIDYLPLLLKHLTHPLHLLPKDEAVQKVVDFMDFYSLSQEDSETILELSKFRGHPNPMDGVPPAVKAALTKAYKERSSTRAVKAADLISLPGLKKAPKKRIAAMLEPVDDGLPEENGDTMLEGEEDSSDTEDAEGGSNINGEPRPQLDLHSDKSKGIQVELDLKTNGQTSKKKTPAAKPRGSQSSEKGSKGSGAGKRKR